MEEKQVMRRKASVQTACLSHFYFSMSEIMCTIATEIIEL